MGHCIIAHWIKLQCTSTSVKSADSNEMWCLLAPHHACLHHSAVECGESISAVAAGAEETIRLSVRAREKKKGSKRWGIGFPGQCHMPHGCSKYTTDRSRMNNDRACLVRTKAWSFFLIQGNQRLIIDALKANKLVINRKKIRTILVRRTSKQEANPHALMEI